MSTEIDIAVCYHKPALFLENDVLHPIQLGKAIAKFDLKIRGDDTGENISQKSKYYSEGTALYWLWKNSHAKIKGILHYRRLLDLSSQDGRSRTVSLEEIKSPHKFLEDLCLTENGILEEMRGVNILVSKKLDIRDWFPGNMEEQFKACHIPEHLDWAMDIIKDDFPDIYPTAKKALGENYAYFCNLCIMESSLFDSMCEFCFSVTAKIEKMTNVNRPEITDGWRYTSRFLSFVFEGLVSMYIVYLQENGKVIKEFPQICITPIGTDVHAMDSHKSADYRKKKGVPAIIPVFDENAVAVMMAANNDYVQSCGTMIQSLIDNSNAKRNYDIVVCSKDISKRNGILLQSMSRKNISVRVNRMDAFLEDFDVSIFNLTYHFTLEAYFRFFIPRIFKNYEKIVYLDSDMVAFRDIAELYDTEIGDCWWAVARDKFIGALGFSMADTYQKKYMIPYIKNVLQMDSPFDYFNSGVMIWNIEKCICDNVFEKCIVSLKKIEKPELVDQCVLNSVANGKRVFWLSNYWNVPWNVPFQWSTAYDSAMFDSAMHLLDNPFILHFSGDVKPWNEPWRPNAEKFWKYARKTPFYEMMLVRLLQQENSVGETYQRIRKKIRKYKILQFITFGMVKAFKERKSKYRRELECMTQYR